MCVVFGVLVGNNGEPMNDNDWEREEWRCAVEAAEDAGEFDDRPTKSDFYGEDFEEADDDDE